MKEYKVGDIVRATSTSGTNYKEGDIGEVAEVDGTMMPLIKWPRRTYYTYETHFKVVCTAKQSAISALIFN